MHITLCPSKEPQGPIPLIHHVHLHRLLSSSSPRLSTSSVPTTHSHSGPTPPPGVINAALCVNSSSTFPSPLTRITFTLYANTTPSAASNPCLPATSTLALPSAPTPTPPPCHRTPYPPPPPPRSAPRPTTRSTSSWPPARPLSHTPASALRTSRRSTAAPWARPPRRAGTRR